MGGKKLLPLPGALQHQAKTFKISLHQPVFEFKDGIGHCLESLAIAYSIGFLFGEYGRGFAMDTAKEKKQVILKFAPPLVIKHDRINHYGFIRPEFKLIEPSECCGILILLSDGISDQI